jgi:uncharacterized protein YeeX (DUF496 family)
MSQNPYAAALQSTLTNEIGRRIFSSFPLHNNSSFVESNELKAEAALQMLNEKLFPNIILSDINSKEKKEMFTKALEINIEKMNTAYGALIDFMIEKQELFPDMRELYKNLQSLAPKKEKDKK